MLLVYSGTQGSFISSNINIAVNGFTKHWSSASVTGIVALSVETSQETRYTPVQYVF